MCKDLGNLICLPSLYLFIERLNSLFSQRRLLSPIMFVRLTVLSVLICKYVSSHRIFCRERNTVIMCFRVSECSNYSNKRESILCLNILPYSCIDISERKISIIL